MLVKFCLKEALIPIMDLEPQNNFRQTLLWLHQSCVPKSGLESKLMAPMNVSLSFKRRKEIRAKGANMIFPASNAYQA